MPAADVLALAKAERASMTMYLTALFFVAVGRTTGRPGRSRGPRTVAASVPVNLRQFFPSASARNFFATIRVTHELPDSIGAPGGSLAADTEAAGAIARALEAQFRPQATPQALSRRLRRLLRAERSPVLRIVPRRVKDILLGRINDLSNRSLTVAVSNLGRAVLPEPAQSHVRRMFFQVSAVRPQFCSLSHGPWLTVTFTSPFVQTAHVREFARMLTERGVDVSVAATRVTESELAEDGA